MIRLIKYDGVSDKSVQAILTGGGGSSSGSGDIPTRGVESASLDRQIWGQKDVGDDIDGSMTVNGDINIRCIIPPKYEDDDSDDGETEETEEGGGNLNVELKITANEVEANEIYAKKTLYIPHPSTKAKTDIVELLKGYDSRITNNKTDIDALKGRVGTAETNISNNSTAITNLTTALNTNTTNIQTNADAIADLQDKVANGISEDYIKQLINQLAISRNGNYNTPIVLISGRVCKFTTGTSYYFTGGQNDNIGYIFCNHKDGLMTLGFTRSDNCQIHIQSVVVTQYRSGDSTDSVETTYLKGRSDGAHWFEARTDSSSDTKAIYIREFHQGNGDNDTWYSDYWGGDGGGIKEVNIIATGYVTTTA